MMDKNLGMIFQQSSMRTKPIRSLYTEGKAKALEAEKYWHRCV